MRVVDFFSFICRKNIIYTSLCSFVVFQDQRVVVDLVEDASFIGKRQYIYIRFFASFVVTIEEL